MAPVWRLGVLSSIILHQTLYCSEAKYPILVCTYLVSPWYETWRLPLSREAFPWIVADQGGLDGGKLARLLSAAYTGLVSVGPVKQCYDSLDGFRNLFSP